MRESEPRSRENESRRGMERGKGFFLSLRHSRLALFKAEKNLKENLWGKGKDRQCKGIFIRRFTICSIRCTDSWSCDCSIEISAALINVSLPRKGCACKGSFHFLLSNQKQGNYRWRGKTFRMLSVGPLQLAPRKPCFWPITGVVKDTVMTTS